MKLIILRTMLLIAILLAIWGIDVSLILFKSNGWVYTFWGQYWRPDDYLHLSMFVVIISAIGLWLTSMINIKKLRIMTEEKSCYECGKILPNDSRYIWACDEYYFCGRECVNKYKRKREARNYKMGEVKQ